MSKKNILNQIEQLLENDNNLRLATEYELPFEIGKPYFIRTVTYFVTGRVKKIVGKFLVLEEAAWITDIGRFSDAMKSGIMDEVEPLDGEMYLNTDSITDAFPFPHKLPNKKK